MSKPIAITSPMKMTWSPASCEAASRQSRTRRALEHRRAGERAVVRDLAEGRFAARAVAGREVARDRLLVRAEDVDGERAVLLDRLRALVPLITQTSTSGGSSESDENALAVMPYA